MSSPRLPGNSSFPNSGVDEDSDDEMDWEDVSTRPVGTTMAVESMPEYDFDVDQDAGPSASTEARAEAGTIEITLKKVQKTDPKRKKQAEQSAELRAIRLTCHKIHTVSLLANAIIRNKWLNDDILQARLASLTPMSLQTSFATITRKRYPDAAKRGRLFETAMMRLTQWWYEEFFEIENAGHIRSRTFDEVQKLLFEIDFEDDASEVIRGSKSLMKHALKHRGSRDVSSQLFTALCRALDIPSRLVVSVQSVPWQANVGKEKSSGKKSSKKGKERADSSAADSQQSDFDAGKEEAGSDDMEEVSIPEYRGSDDRGGTGAFPGVGQALSGSATPTTPILGERGKALPKHVVKLRKSRPSGHRLGSKSRSRQSTPVVPIGGSPPVFWTEVFSRPDGKWMPVDPTRYIVNKRRVFQPSQNDRNNRMVYVVAVEEDGYCRDVTARYARDYGTKTAKAQLGGIGRKEWWESVVALVTRPYRLVRDDVEDEEFEYFKFIEGMPTSVAGFKNHPLYVLEQHLKREEVISPRTEIGKFRGEPVYPRSNVITLKTADNWIRVGLRVKEGAQPLKWVKQRAVTINRRRVLELARQEGDEVLQGLYSEAQTEPYVPDPVVNGVVPKNDFGNIDLYTPSMLPKGASHIPYRGAAKIARKLGFDYAEAVTSFEFKKGRAFPVLRGIVVASENEEVLLEAYWAAEREAEEKDLLKRRERVIKRWSRLIQGLRIRQRLQKQYAGDELDLRNNAGEIVVEVEQQGGFLTEADAVVQPFHLPRFEHGMYQPTVDLDIAPERDEIEIHDKLTVNGDVGRVGDKLPPPSADLDGHLTGGTDDELEEVFPVTNAQRVPPTEVQVPKSMLDFAKENEARQSKTNTGAFNIEDGGTLPEAHEKSEPSSNQHIDNHTERPPRSRGFRSSVAKGLDKNSSVTKARRPQHSGRKSAENISSSEHLNPDEDLGSGSINEEMGDVSHHNGSSRSVARRTRPNEVSTAPSPSTRVLRARVPKTADQIRAEREAEAAYRRAVAE